MSEKGVVFGVESQSPSPLQMFSFEWRIPVFTPWSSPQNLPRILVGLVSIEFFAAEVKSENPTPGSLCKASPHSNLGLFEDK